MADIFTRQKRSLVMSRIRGDGNKSTELALLGLLRYNGVSGWRRRWPLLGKPDFVFPKQRLAVFVDGCFWHGCPRHYRLPGSNVGFWKGKVEANRKRASVVNKDLRKKGWSVVRIWECALRERPGHCVSRIKRHLCGGEA
jgi:DNA mismatch endonuclease (patch repair protein)